MSDARNSESRLPVHRYLPSVFLFVLLSLVLYARFRLLQLPLERDEGEFAYIGQLLLNDETLEVSEIGVHDAGRAAFQHEEPDDLVGSALLVDPEQLSDAERQGEALAP